MITLDGQPASAGALLSALSRLFYDLDNQTNLAPCDHCGGAGELEDGTQCVSPPGEWVVDHQWSHCPYGMLTSRQWAAWVRLDAARRVSPLSGWPSAFACGTVTALIALRNAEIERDVRLQKEAQRRARGR